MQLCEEKKTYTKQFKHKVNEQERKEGQSNCIYKKNDLPMS